MNFKVLENDYAIYIRRFQDLCILVSAYGYPRIQANWAVYTRTRPSTQEMANAEYPLTMTDVSNKVEYLAVDIVSQAPPGKDNESRDQSGSPEGKSCGNKRVRTRKTYQGSNSKCLFRKLHHPLTTLCHTCRRCNRLNHFAKQCHEETKLEAPVRVQDPAGNKKVCFGCGSQGHYRRECLETSQTSGQG